MAHPSQANYLLIDGALRPNALAGLYQRHELFEIEALYLGTRWKDLHDLGPILIKPDARSPLLSEWLEHESLRKDSTLLYSRADIEQVAAHLRHFISPPDCQGGGCLLRFADPLVTHFWLSSYPCGASQHLGPIEQWWVGSPRHTWESPQPMQWQTFSGSGTESAWDERHAVLSEDQLDALDLAQRWRFTGRLYNWLGERNPDLFSGFAGSQISDWLNSSLQAGLEWGLITERALAMWMEACADYGQDFATRAQSPYQQWLRQNETNAGLAPELRIRAFELHSRTYKEVVHD
ncbi:DUF4123 domain-containing protein [Pseudomonas sp. DWP3-1-2]|uniref:DUF4123 domain-containing protein n=1 Tax=Pseudomonas sp. DWP3-1-2 TaxID=2804645 RepID=UPI003CECE5BD